MSTRCLSVANGHYRKIPELLKIPIQLFPKYSLNKATSSNDEDTERRESRKSNVVLGEVN